MNQDHKVERDSANENATTQIFRCPVCRGHRLSVIFEIYGMRDIVGVKPDSEVLFGTLDQQGINYGTCSCPDCEWKGEFYRDDDAERCFDRHLVPTTFLEFTCPKCGGHELRRIRQGHTTSYLVSAVYRDLSDDAEKVAVDMLDREDQGGQFVYGCGSCHRPLTDDADAPITEKDALVAWLKSHQ
jgi:Zn finger protein HypA/HybF involved in hydrogenase expression